MGFTCNNSFGQEMWFDEEEDAPKGPQAMQQGDFMITAFSSYPNFGRYLAQTSLLSNDVSNFTVGGVAPLGLQLEYMLSNTIAFTTDGIFNSWSATWQHNFLGEIFSNRVSETRFRFLVGLNYHLDDLDNEKFNFYAGGAIGINQRSFVKEVDDYWSDSFWIFDINSPLAFRARTGMRFFINKQWGLNLELGAGGPVLRFGLTYRFREDAEAKELKNKL